MRLTRARTPSSSRRRLSRRRISSWNRAPAAFASRIGRPYGSTAKQPNAPASTTYPHSTKSFRDGTADGSIAMAGPSEGDFFRLAGRAGVGHQAVEVHANADLKPADEKILQRAGPRVVE